jgi:predicted metal-binding transcription factor (methanogenesis marker protein 9)
MSKTFILYNILQEQGIDKERAEEAVSAFITRDEVRETLATKDDLRKLTMWIAGMLIGQVAIMTAIISMLAG